MVDETAIETPPIGDIWLTPALVGEKIKIVFNPKITALKRNIKTTVTETLGSKYPFIRRNNVIGYDTFSIEGLISRHVQDNVSFDSDYETEARSEREFRDRLLEILHSDQAFKFQSFTEGDKIVRLTNISLTPMTQLSRVIYTVSIQAVEIDDIENWSRYETPITTTVLTPIGEVYQATDTTSPTAVSGLENNTLIASEVSEFSQGTEA